MRAENICLICGSLDHEEKISYDAPDKYEEAAGVIEENYFRKWIKCLGCGFHYSIYSRPADILDLLYEKIYRDPGSFWRKESAVDMFRRVIKLPDEQSETRRRVKWIKEKMGDVFEDGVAPAGKPPYEMLDIGGATGVFAYEFKDDQWRSSVADPSEEGRFLQEEYQIPYVQKKYMSGLFDHKFDLISLVFSLEHISDPDSLLTDVKADLSERSFIYIEVPDAIAFDLKQQDDDIFNSCHLWMFDPHTLLRLMSRCGFHAYSLDRVKTIRGHYSLMVIGGPVWK